MKSEKEDNEWLNEYPSLKQVKSKSPFTVPSGYFDELGERISSAVFLDELKGTSALHDGFSVPENYFDQLAGNIQSRVNIEERIGADAGFSIPEGYFDDLQQQIQSRVQIEEALAGKNEAFTVPDGYFNELSANILAKTTGAQKDNRGAVIRKLFNSVSLKYATAACIIAMVGGGIFFRQIQEPTAVHKRSFLHQELETIPDAEIESYLQLHMDAADTRSLIDNGADADLQDFLSTN